MSGWRFSLADPTWEDGVDAVPTEERKREFWEIAVRRFATHAGPRPPQPCLVVCRVTAPARWGRPPGGPLGRAKGLLDALHDDRRSGPRYGACAPLEDDHPEHVSGLAVEVRAGEPRTDYLVGRGLRIAGELLASVPVAVEAPNDIVGTLGEKARIAVDRIAYGRAVREAFASYAGLMNRRPAALVVPPPAARRGQHLGDVNRRRLRCAQPTRGALGRRGAADGMGTNVDCEPR